ncbi:MAG: AAA family ATPase [Phycisphaerae bacterium]
MIVLLTGPSNVGKSTVSEQIARRWRAVHLKVDELRHFIVDDKLRRAEQFQRELTHANIMDLLGNYAARGMDVLVDDISADPEYHTRRMADYGRIAPASSILLMCRRELVLTTRNRFSDTSFMASRLGNTFEGFRRMQAAGAYDWVLDTSDLTVTETVAALEDRLRELGGLE